MLPLVPGQTKEERFLEALAIVNERNAAGATKGQETPAPAPAHANAGVRRVVLLQCCVVKMF